jgi:hypothetical protein
MGQALFLETLAKGSLRFLVLFMCGAILTTSCSCPPKGGSHNPDTQDSSTAKAPFPLRRLAESPGDAAGLALQFLKHEGLRPQGRKDSLAVKFGFPSPEALEKAELADPMRYHSLDCRWLAEKGDGVRTLEDLESLAGESPWMYPVVNGREARMGIWVDSIPADAIPKANGFVHSEDKGRFTMMRMGGAAASIGIASGLRRLRETEKIENFAVIEIPVLFQTLIAFKKGEDLQVQVVYEGGDQQTDCELESGRTLLWSEAVKRMISCPEYSSQMCAFNPAQNLPPKNGDVRNGDPKELQNNSTPPDIEPMKKPKQELK